MIIGCDISQWQGEVDFQKMKSAGAQYVYMRGTLGFTKDKRLDANRAGAQAAGLPWGIYHCLVKSRYTAKQIQAFINSVDGNWGDLPPVVDVEVDGVGLGLVKEWIIAVEKASGKKPIIYTRAGFWDPLIDTKGIKKWCGQYDLWVANYKATSPRLPMPWKNLDKRWLLWQYSADENKLGTTYGVQSIPIDLNYFNGDAFDFAVWSGAGEEEPLTGKVRVIKTAQLWGRTAPVYGYTTKRILLNNGEEFEKAGEPVYDAESGITWQPIKLPEEIVFASKSYLKEI